MLEDLTEEGLVLELRYWDTPPDASERPRVIGELLAHPSPDAGKRAVSLMSYEPGVDIPLLAWLGAQDGSYSVRFRALQVLRDRDAVERCREVFELVGRCDPCELVRVTAGNALGVDCVAEPDDGPRRLAELVARRGAKDAAEILERQASSLLDLANELRPPGTRPMVAEAMLLPWSGQNVPDRQLRALLLGCSRDTHRRGEPQAVLRAILEAQKFCGEYDLRSLDAGIALDSTSPLLDARDPRLSIMLPAARALVAQSSSA